MSNRFFSLYLLLAFLFLSATSTAQIYQWRDKEGQLHFGDKPPVEAKAKQVEVKINSYDSVEVVTELGIAINSKSKHQRGRVVIYTTQSCHYCKKAKQYFRNNNIAFSEYDVNKSAKGKRDFKRMGATAVPIILVGRTRMNGFAKARFEQIYNSKK